MFKVSIESRLSVPGNRSWNEDRCNGHAEPQRGHVWVIDGATGLAERDHIPGADSDASWLAQFLDEQFLQHPAHNLSKREDVKRMLEAVRERYWALVGDSNIEDFALPSATALYAAWEIDENVSFRFSHLGDCSAILLSAGSSCEASLIGALSRGEWESQLHKQIRSLNESGRDFDRPLIDQLRDTVVAHRREMNRPGGYWIFGTDPAAAAHLREETVTMSEPGFVLLMTDGFSRLIDPFAAYTPSSLVEAARDKGLEHLMTELRQWEDRDETCVAFPRIKPYDDATAVLISVARTG